MFELCRQYPLSGFLMLPVAIFGTVIAALVVPIVVREVVTTVVVTVLNSVP